MAMKRGGNRNRDAAINMKQAGLACRCPVSVTPEQRRHLIECVATIRVARFRTAQPGECRKDDLRQAATEIDAILDENRCVVCHK